MELVPALLKGFAAHRKEPGKADDHWLPPDVYDASLWTVDNVYLYVITDGNVGRPTPDRIKQTAELASCEVCRPSTARDGAAHAGAISRLREQLQLGDEQSPAASKHAQTWLILLQEVGLADDAHLTLIAQLGCDLQGGAAELGTAGRPAFLARLKAAGFDRLNERQQIVNAMARASREGRLAQKR